MLVLLARHRPLVLLALVGVLASGCDTFDDDTPPLREDFTDFVFTFEDGLAGWDGDFADYAQEMEGDLELVFERRPLPEEVDEEGMALFLAGTNRSDDLFMFVKRQVDGFAPKTEYEVTYEIEIASNAPSGCVGIGGPPGESVFLKVGAAAVEPEPVLEDGDFRLNVDKGGQSQGGDDAVVVGNIANGVNRCTGTPYRLLSFTNRNDPLTVETDEDGALWLFVGTDSGFEGRTALFYNTIAVTVSR